MLELPTERTEIMITTFITEGRAASPAFWIEMTNGEALEVLVPDVKARDEEEMRRLTSYQRCFGRSGAVGRRRGRVSRRSID